ncbi:MAG: class I SAM-dependent methyltransferase [Gaiellaceae bacterium]
MSISEDLRRNRAAWTKANEKYTDARAAEAWAQGEIEWGTYGVPEAELNTLGDVTGKDAVELGCGTAYFSAWLGKRGARPVGVDITPAQLQTARRMQAQTGIEFPLVEADAADVPLPDASFDLALSEYGASIWVDPEKWIPEAHRLLRTGGELVFLCNSPLSVMCTPDEGKIEERLLRSQFELGRMEWPGEDEGVEYHLGHGDMLRLLRHTGFEVIGLWELQAPEEAIDHEFYDFVPAEWARRWPAEEIWKARKR